MNNLDTTLTIRKTTRKDLETCKEFKRETMNDVVQKLIKFWKKGK